MYFIETVIFFCKEDLIICATASKSVRQSVFIDFISKMSEIRKYYLMVLHQESRFNDGNN